MQILRQSPSDFTFYLDAGRHRLMVVCGTTAVFEVTFTLDEQELQSYRERGDDFLQTLVYRVRDSPGDYVGRK